MDKNSRSAQELWKYVRSYLTVYLPRIRGLSPRTVESYRESISMYCLFLKEASRIDFSKTSFDHVTRDSVMKFVQSLRKPRMRSLNMQSETLLPQVTSQVLRR